MKKTQITAIKRIISKNKTRPALQGIFTDSRARVCACCDYYCIRVNAAPPEDIPTAAGIDINKFFEVARGEELPAPSLDAARYYVKNPIIDAYGKKRPVYDFGDDLPRVNARYLLDMLRIFPDARIYTTAHNPKNRAIFFESAFGDGLLMPIYKE